MALCCQAACGGASNRRASGAVEVCLGRELRGTAPPPPPPPPPRPRGHPHPPPLLLLLLSLDLTLNSKISIIIILHLRFLYPLPLSHHGHAELRVPKNHACMMHNMLTQMVLMPVWVYETYSLPWPSTTETKCGLDCQLLSFSLDFWLGC